MSLKNLRSLFAILLLAVLVATGCSLDGGAVEQSDRQMPPTTATVPYQTPQTTTTVPIPTTTTLGTTIDFESIEALDARVDELVARSDCEEVDPYEFLLAELQAVYGDRLSPARPLDSPGLAFDLDCQKRFRGWFYDPVGGREANAWTQVAPIEDGLLLDGSGLLALNESVPRDFRHPIYPEAVTLGELEQMLNASQASGDGEVLICRVSPKDFEGDEVYRQESLIRLAVKFYVTTDGSLVSYPVMSFLGVSDPLSMEELGLTPYEGGYWSQGYVVLGTCPDPSYPADTVPFSPGEQELHSA